MAPVTVGNWELGYVHWEWTSIHLSPPTREINEGSYNAILINSFFFLMLSVYQLILNAIILLTNEIEVNKHILSICEILALMQSC